MITHFTVHVFMCMFIYICIPVLVQAASKTLACVHSCFHVCVYVYLCLCLSIFMPTYTYMRMSVYVSMALRYNRYHTYVCVYVYANTMQNYTYQKNLKKHKNHKCTEYVSYAYLYIVCVHTYV